MSELKYVLAPENWVPSEANPFTGEAFDNKWSGLVFLDRDDDQFRNGTVSSGLYLVSFGRRVSDVHYRVADFLRYEAERGRTTIVSAEHDLDIEEFLCECLDATPHPCQVRTSDPRIVVHTTSLSAWRSIEAEGELKSPVWLRREGIPYRTIGFQELGEPPEYEEYIHLGRIDNWYPEFIVLSQQRGRICTDENASYTPGVRLYFDCQAIIRGGLGVRDGLHLLKVKDRLPLTPYLVASASLDEVDPDGAVREWTPKTFWQAANRYFRRKVG